MINRGKQEKIEVFERKKSPYKGDVTSKISGENKMRNLKKEKEELELEKLSLEFLARRTDHKSTYARKFEIQIVEKNRY